MKHWSILSLLILEATSGRAGPVRVAMTDFTSDDNSYRSQVAAANLADAVRGQLAAANDWDWVERQQIESAARELHHPKFGTTGSESALRLGKWVKADVVVLGRFQPGDDNQHVLRLEIVDLRRADLLAERELRWGQTIAGFGDADVKRVADALGEALRAATKAQAETEGKATVAPLFLRNTGQERRLDFFEEDFQTALAKAAGPAGVRVLRFPRSRNAAGEAELVVRGLVQDDPSAWERVADYYVWADFAERESSGIPFPQVVVDMTVHVWDGRHPVQTLRDAGCVGELPALGERLSRAVMAVTRSHINESAGDQTRDKIAEQLLAQARAIRQKFTSQSGLLDYRATAESQRARRYVVGLLEMACLFMPASVEAHRERILTRWGRGKEFHDDIQFVLELAEAREWGEFVERFGTKALDEPSDAYRDYDKRLPALQQASDVRQAYVESAHWTLVRFGNPALGFPRDMPEEEKARWRSELETEYVARTVVAQDPQFLAQCFSLVKDARLRVKMCEALWPIVLNPLPHHARVQMPHTFWEEQLRKTYRDAGIPEEAERLLSMGRPSAASPKEIVHEKRFEVPRLNFLPPALPVTQRKLSLAGEFHTVTALAFHRGKLWISAQGAASSTVSSGSLLDYLCFTHTTNAVLTYDPATGVANNIAARLGLKARALAFRTDADHLWIATQQDGVWRVDTATHNGQHYRPREGLLSLESYTLAHMDARWYVGGGPDSASKLSAFNLRDAMWSAVDTSAWYDQVTDGTRFGRITHVVASGPWLLVYAGAGQPWLLDTREGRWFNLRDLLVGGAQDVSRPSRVVDIVASAVDARGFWIGTTAGLVQFDPGTGVVNEHLSPCGQFLYDQAGHFPIQRAQGRVRSSFLPHSRILGGVTALADDGEYLWVATTTDFRRYEFQPSDVDGHYVMLWHKPSARWVGQFRVKARVTSLAVSPTCLWIGMAGGPDVLTEVEKRSLMENPTERWIADEISTEELTNRLKALPLRIQTRYAFLLGDYAKVVSLLVPNDPKKLDSEALFMLGYSHDPLGLNQPDKAWHFFEEIITRNENPAWVKEARTALSN